jgi:hypothetical protein
MCVACGLPTTHVGFWQTVSLTSLLFSCMLTFLWVYLIITRAYLQRLIRRVLDKLVPTPPLQKENRPETKQE